ncbi:MAG: HAD-IB family hydrolase [Gammaproteobacteria bacterium]|nr:MAG: HAD-IB family hydrolase [Gammaproteobacteria bacterium]
MALAIFDLDNTLLGGDSDYLWGEFLVEQNHVDAEYHQHNNDVFYQQYLAGTMDIFEFLEFQLKPLADNSIETLNQWRQQYLAEKIAPIMLPAARKLIAKHQQQGDTLLIITATNSFITAPIAEQLSIPHLIATEAELIDGQYTGKVAGTPSYQQGKVTRLNQWLTEQKLDLSGSYFYSDSHNDLPLLKLVEHPIAVDADDKLKAVATQQGWDIISLR